MVLVGQWSAQVTCLLGTNNNEYRPQIAAAILNSIFLILFSHLIASVRRGVIAAPVRVHPKADRGQSGPHREYQLAVGG